jgi:hypothetical protein
MKINTRLATPGVWLLPGQHQIDNVRVEVPDGVRLSDGTVFLALSIGKHVVDDKIVIVQPSRAVA